MDLRYVAGLVDGEGCITLIRQKANGGASLGYRPILQVALVYKPVVVMLQTAFGGYVKHYVRKNPKHRNYAMWKLYGRQAVDLVRELEPFLIIKKKEAQLLIAFWDDRQVHVIGGAKKKLNAEARAAIESKREWYRLSLQALKKYEFGSSWDVGEFGENPERATPSQAENDLFSGVCNEQVPTAKAKICSELHGNMQSVAEMTTPEVKH